MPTFGSEGTHAGEFIISEANGSRSRESGTLTSGENLVAGAVLGIVANKYVEYDNAASSGAETAVAILFDAVDATDDDADCVVLVRDAEVNASELIYEATQDQASIDASIVDLLTVGIVGR